MSNITGWRYAGQEDCEPLHYTWCGLDDVFLLSGYQKIPSEDGDEVVIQDMDGLHKAIGVHIAKTKKVLNGKDIRFLRHAMDLTQSELGDLLGVSDQAVARWEKQERPISGPADLLLRALYLAHIHEIVNIRQLAEEIRVTDAPIAEKQVFKEKDGEWLAVAA